MKITTEITVRYSDIDAMGHVNNAVYLNYFEEARIGFFNSTVGEKWDWKDQGIVLARNEIDYMSPILLNDRVVIDTQVERVGNKSMRLSYIVHNGEQPPSRRLFAKGSSVIVTFDYSKGAAKEIPESWRELFQKK